METRHKDLSPVQVQDRLVVRAFATIILVGLILLYAGINQPQVHSDFITKEQVQEIEKEWINDENLTDDKPTDWRRLNSNWFSQRYIHLEGEGREERMKSLLASYWFDNYEVRKTIARVFRIYPETLICVAYADSSLGRFLKTEHNYWNVWNNDRGETMSFHNSEAWIHAIWKVLTNRYLWNKMTLWELSPYEWGEAPFYATSPENREINVLNCHGMIYNKRIDWDWKFRW